MREQTQKEDALCVYELCGCGASTDGHCMMCLRPITEHRLIPAPEIAEIQARFAFYDQELSTLRAEQTRLREALVKAREGLDDYWAEQNPEALDLIRAALSPTSRQEDSNG